MGHATSRRSASPSHQRTTDRFTFRILRIVSRRKSALRHSRNTVQRPIRRARNRQHPIVFVGLAPPPGRDGSGSSDDQRRRPDARRIMTSSQEDPTSDGGLVGRNRRSPGTRDSSKLTRSLRMSFRQRSYSN